MFAHSLTALILSPWRRRAVPCGHARPGRWQPNQNRARFRLEALEGRCLLSAISGVTEYPIPSGTGGAWSITTGRDGNLWFTESPTSNNRIGMINPTTHAVTEFTTPTAGSGPKGITSGPDGNLWFTESSADKLGMINPTTHAVTEFAIPAGAGPSAITGGPDGNLWFTQQNGDGSGAIGMFNPTTHAFSSFLTPTFGAGGSGPDGICVGPDGNLWFTEYSGDKIGVINPATHVINEFPLPTAWLNPYDIAAGSDGNLWFTVPSSSHSANTTLVGMINPTTHAISLLATPDGAHGITSGPDGDLWLGEGPTIGRVNPTTDAITEFPAPNSGAFAITSGPDGNLWFSDNGTKSIGVATLGPTETDLVVTQSPPPSLTAGAPFGLTVQADDASGNLLSSFNGPVTVALAANPGGATLGGTLTVTASNGVATFSGLSLTKAAAGYTLVVSSGVSGEGFTGALTVTPAAATQLVFMQQPPSSVRVGSAFGLQAAIEDQYGNVVTSANNGVTVALATNPGGATLGGTTTMTAVNGVITFSDLTLNKRGTGYNLRLSSAGLTGVTSGPITAK